MKIWIKLQTQEKTLAHTTVECKGTSQNDLLLALRFAAQLLDCATPVLLAAHYDRFLQFGVVRFRADDFVESVAFDKMEVEWLKEKRQSR